MYLERKIYKHNQMRKYSLQFIFYGFEVCIVRVQQNNFFFQLIKIVKQWDSYLNLYHKVILYYKILNPIHTQN